MYWHYVVILIILVLISFIVIKINKLIEFLGGKDNILDVETNISRLKVVVRDVSIVNKDGIQKLGAKGIVEVDNQLKIIYGPNSKQLKKFIKDLK